MTEEANKKRPTLAHTAALDRWRKRHDAWNNWIHQNPGTDISFSGVDFSHYRDADGNLSFAGYHFGTGNVDFSNAIFGDGNVDFSGATFGGGSVDFSKTIFGAGDLDFTNVDFGTGEVKFILARFGEGILDFAEADFGNVNFARAHFGKGLVKFNFTTFGNVNFNRASFGDSYVDFSCATFKGGSALFSATELDNGTISFSEASFPAGELVFSQSRIENLYFTPKTIGSSNIKAEGISIKGRAIFDLPSSTSSIKSLNLHSASFDGPLTLKGDLSIIPDLRATRSSHQVELSDLKVKLRRKQIWSIGVRKIYSVTEDPQDGARLRRLKEIAETNKDHQAALRFSADENRAKRWIETSWFGSVLDMAFSAFSNYGQSILRPSFWLGVIFALSMYAYKAKQIPKLVTDGWADWAQAALLSASNSLPFLPQSRELRTGALKALYDTDSSSYVDALMITQGVLSFIFLFLIGLGLRNRFRL